MFSRIVGALSLSLALVAVAVPPAGSAVHVDDRPERSWGVNGRVYAVVMARGAVFVGGSFTAAVSPSGATTPRRNLAAFDLETGALLPWRADAGASVRALVHDGTWLYVGGGFGRLGNQPHARLGRVRIDTGAVDSAFSPSLNGAVRALELDGNRIFAGGAFTTVNGASRQHVAKIGIARGLLDGQFRGAANDQVWGLAKHPRSSVLYVSGRFGRLNGSSRNGVGALSSTTGATTRTVFGSAARPTLGLETNDDGTRLYGAGGTGGNALAAWNTSTGVRVWRRTAGGDIQAVDYYDGTVYFGFHDGFQQDKQLKVLAANAGTGAVDSGFRPRFNKFWGVFAIHASRAGVAIGGDFTTINGSTARNWARFRP